ncbi:MAG: hypothetical protein ACREJM_03410, partial [Candidatus Saccharimonadales bacterium]
IFEGGFDQLDAFNALGAGYRGAVTVELEDRSRYSVVFYDIVRLQQDLDEELKQGAPFIAEPGMIVLTEVSLDNMKAAVSQLQDQGYFSRLKSEGGASLLHRTGACRAGNGSVTAEPALRCGRPACLRR